MINTQNYTLQNFLLIFFFLAKPVYEAQEIIPKRKLIVKQDKKAPRLEKNTKTFCICRVVLKYFNTFFQPII